MRYRVSTPVPGYAGAVGAVAFANGVAEFDGDAHPAELAYFQARGYQVDEITKAAEGAGLEAEPAEPAEPAESAMPKRSASTEAWRAYAAASGELSEDEAGAMSRDELVEYFTEEN